MTIAITDAPGKGRRSRWVVYSLLTVRRLRENEARVVRIPRGAILVIDSAKFHASDVSDRSIRCWFHNGSFPRFLRANEPFKA